MSEISDWLSDLGLERYASAFARAEIEFADLPHLTNEDLAEVGLPVGPRRRVQNAIEQLAADAAASSEVSNTVGSPHPTRQSPSSVDAERRHLSVMFVDLVGSTEMAATVDAEDVRAVITGYQNAVARIVTGHDGFVARYMGDGVLGYFGWPRANEDDAERAVRAGLEIIAAISATPGPLGAPLAARVGIATGVVIVGDLIGSGASEEAAVVGETPNLAARLQGLAQPNQLAIAQETRGLLGNVFQCEPLGTKSLKGIAKPVTAFLVHGEAMRESRFDARHASQLTPIVGRERELRLVRECWTRAKSGTGQMVVISGEAGIGKSRIVRAVTDEIEQDRPLRITYQCSPYHTESAFYPILQQLTYAAGIEPTDSNDGRLIKLEGLAGIDVHNIALVGTLLGIDTGERYAPLNLTPAQLRARTIQALVKMLAGLARRRPVLVVFEDLHWIDPTTLELLDVSLDAVGDEKILILATARPSFGHSFGGHPVVTRFALNRLDKEQISSIVRKLTDGKSLPVDVFELIASRTDGVPLFVEELTKTVLETGKFIDEGDRLVLGTPLDALVIPNTLHDSLMARLDRLQPIKDVAQTAACIGRRFDHTLLGAISPLPAKELNAALEALIAAELIYRRGLPPEATYLFKHALVRDAAYNSLLKDRRRGVHARILAVLVKQPEVAPEVLAHHAEAAGQTERAIDFWEAASKAAIGRPAYDEGILHLERALGLLSPQLESGDRAAVERALGLQIQLGIACLVRRGYQADATRIAFDVALAFVEQIGQTPMRYPVLYGLWGGMHVRAEHAQALRQAEALVGVAQGSEETAPLVVAHRLAGVSLCFQGRLREAQASLDRALSRYDPVAHVGLEDRFGQDVGVSVHAYQAINLALRGRTQLAEQHARDAERLAGVSGHVNTFCYAGIHLALVALYLQDEAEVERNLDACHSIAEEHGLLLWANYASMMREIMAAAKGDPSSVARYHTADSVIVATKVGLFVPSLRVAMGWQVLRLGFTEQAQRLASMAHSLMDQTGELVSRADAHHLEGAVARREGDSQMARVRLSKAIEVARDQGAGLWQLRASVDLAELWQSMSRNSDAASLLETVLASSLHQSDCPRDLARASKVLAQVAG